MEGEELCPGAAEALAADDVFLRKVMERWDMNNNRGSDRAWNLDDAIVTTLQQWPEF